MNVNILGDKLSSEGLAAVGTVLTPYVRLDSKGRMIDDPEQAFQGLGVQDYGSAVMAGPGCARVSFSSSVRGMRDGTRVEGLVSHPYFYDMGDGGTVMIPPVRPQYCDVQHGRSKSDLARTVFCARHQMKLPDKAFDDLKRRFPPPEAFQFQDDSYIESYISPAAQPIHAPGADQQLVDVPPDAESPTERKAPPRMFYGRRVSRQSLHKHTVCSNCGTEKTSLWRRSSSGEPLCNACGLFRKLHGSSRPISLKTDVIRKRNRSRGSIPRCQAQQNTVVRQKGSRVSVLGDVTAFDSATPAPAATQTDIQQCDTSSREKTSQQQEQCDPQAPDGLHQYEYIQRAPTTIDRDGPHAYVNPDQTSASSDTAAISPEKNKGPDSASYHSLHDSDQSKSTEYFNLRRLSLDSRDVFSYGILPTDSSAYWKLQHIDPSLYTTPTLSQQPLPQQPFPHPIQDLQQADPSDSPSGYFPRGDQHLHTPLLSTVVGPHERPPPVRTLFPPEPAYLRSRNAYLRGVHRRSFSGDILTRPRFPSQVPISPFPAKPLSRKIYAAHPDPLFVTENRLSAIPVQVDQPIHPDRAHREDFVSDPNADMFGHHHDSLPAAPPADMRNLPHRSHLAIQ